jgi:hypothetical protein
MNSVRGRNLDATWYGFDEYTVLNLIRGDDKPCASSAQ